MKKIYGDEKNIFKVIILNQWKQKNLKKFNNIFEKSKKIALELRKMEKEAKEFSIAKRAQHTHFAQNF